MRESSTTLRARYVETDQMGVVHHSVYLAWMEVARTDYLRDRGMPYKALEEKGIRMPVLSVQTRYLSPARYDDEIMLKTRLVESNGVRFSFEYDILRTSDQTLICRGRTEHAATDLDGRPRRIPRDLLALIGGDFEAR
jgi:acyl-CoA thioester hydrolase